MADNPYASLTPEAQPAAPAAANPYGKLSSGNPYDALTKVKPAAAKEPSRDPLRGAKAVYGGARRIPEAVPDATYAKLSRKPLDYLARFGDASAAGMEAGVAGKDPAAAWRGVMSQGGDLAQRADTVSSATKHIVGAMKGGAQVGMIPNTLTAGIGALLEKLPSNVQDAIVGGSIDPLSVLGSTGLIERFGGVAARKALVAGVRASAKNADTRKLAQGLMEKTTPGGKNVGISKYNLIANHGEKGLDDFRKMRSIQKANESVKHAGTNFSLAELKKSFAGLSPADQSAIFEAVDRNTISRLPAELRPRAEAFRDVYRAIGHLEGDKPVKEVFAKAGFKLPDQLAQYDKPRQIMNRKQIRGRGHGYVPRGPELDHADQVRFGLVPERQQLGEEELLAAMMGLDAKPKTARFAGKDAHLQARETDMPIRTPERQQQINEGRVRSGWEAIAYRDTLRQAARELTPGHPVNRTVTRLQAHPVDPQAIYRQAVSGLNPEDTRAVNALIQKTPESTLLPGLADRMKNANIRARAQSVLDAGAHNAPVRTTVQTARRSYRVKDLPIDLQRMLLPDERKPETTLGKISRSLAGGTKVAMFFDPRRHMLNVQMLAALADPYSAAKATVRYGMSGAWLPDSVATLVAPVTHKAAASQARAIDAAIKAGAMQVNPERDIPHLISVIPGVRNVYRWSSNTLWRFDEAQKATRFDALLKSGMKPHEAAERVGSELIDYGDKSELTRKLAYIAPFATYRSKLPGAVGRSVARHPERALTINRLSPGLAGGTVQVGSDEQARSGLPLAEGLELPEDPTRYARSMLGFPARAAATAVTGGKWSYMTNGLPGRDIRQNGTDPLVAWAKLIGNNYLGPIMGSQQVLQALGMSEYEPRSLDESLSEGPLGAYTAKRR